MDRFKVILSLLVLSVGGVGLAQLKPVLTPVTEYEYPDFDGDCSLVKDFINDYTQAVVLMDKETNTSLKELSDWSLKISKNLKTKLGKPHQSVKKDLVQLKSVLQELQQINQTIVISSEDLLSHFADDLLDCAAAEGLVAEDPTEEGVLYDYVESLVRSFQRIHNESAVVIQGRIRSLNQEIKRWETYKSCGSTSSCPIFSSDWVENLNNEAMGLKLVQSCQTSSQYSARRKFCEWTDGFDKTYSMCKNLTQPPKKMMQLCFNKE